MGQLLLGVFPFSSFIIALICGIVHYSIVSCQYALQFSMDYKTMVPWAQSDSAHRGTNRMCASCSCSCWSFLELFCVSVVIFASFYCHLFFLWLCALFLVSFVLFCITICYNIRPCASLSPGPVPGKNPAE